MSSRGYRTIKLKLKKGAEASVYTSPRLADALERIIAEELDVFNGVKLVQILEAVYSQGKKDGARQVIEEQDKAIALIKRSIPHKRPGRPLKTAARKRR